MQLATLKLNSNQNFLMGAHSYFSSKKQSLRSTLKKLKSKMESILKLDSSKREIKVEEDMNQAVGRNISIKSPLRQNHTIMNDLERPYSTLPAITQKEVLRDSVESGEENNNSEKELSIPDGSRVLSISLIKGQVIEKVYVTPSGERISFKGNQL